MMIVQFFIVLKDYFIEVLAFLAVGFFLSGLIHEFAPTGCAIFQQIGKCIMPKEGVFAKVIHGGLVRAGDTIKREA